jgi:hypothetical protein
MPKCPVALEGDTEMVEWENWARNQLMAAGSDLLSKFSNLQVTTKNHYPKAVKVVYHYCLCCLFLNCCCCCCCYIGS